MQTGALGGIKATSLLYIMCYLNSQEEDRDGAYGEGGLVQWSLGTNTVGMKGIKQSQAGGNWATTQCKQSPSQPWGSWKLEWSFEVGQGSRPLRPYITSHCCGLSQEEVGQSSYLQLRTSSGDADSWEPSATTMPSRWMSDLRRKHSVCYISLSYLKPTIWCYLSY